MAIHPHSGFLLTPSFPATWVGWSLPSRHISRHRPTHSPTGKAGHFPPHVLYDLWCLRVESIPEEFGNGLGETSPSWKQRVKVTKECTDKGLSVPLPSSSNILSHVFVGRKYGEEGMIYRKRYTSLNSSMLSRAGPENSLLWRAKIWRACLQMPG